MIHIKNTAIAMLLLLATVSCEEIEREANFEDTEDKTIYSYLAENDSLAGSFMKILNASGLAKTLSAYNPDGIGYTLFLPDSIAVMNFVSNHPSYSTLDELLADSIYSKALVRYHVVNLGIDANDFPFGALPEYTLSRDLLTVNFVIETDTSYYLINNQAPVTHENIELSNGFIHVIGEMLDPITFTTYEWLQERPGFSIFLDAVEATGFQEILSRDLKDTSEVATGVTLLLEHDSIFNRNGIFSLDDLIDHLDPDDDNYTSPKNALYGFVGYHILDANRFLDDFADNATNFTTFSEVPVNVNGRGLDILVNKGRQVFDTVISAGDTTIIDYIGFNYDQSNVITQSGAIHFIDQLMEERPPRPARVTFEFYNEPFFSDLREEAGEYLVDDPTALSVISWHGSELIYVKSADPEHPAWSDDYLFLDGDFVISYTVPKVVSGRYMLKIRGDVFNDKNAVIEVFLDGKKIGGLIDLTDIGTSNWYYRDVEVGVVDLASYEEHVVEIRSLIPGRFNWDHVQFDPVKD